MAERQLDRLLPTALALVTGVTAFAWLAAAIVTDFSIGRPSSSAAFGIVVMVPLSMLAAMVGFAIGHLIGVALRRRNLTPAVPMKPYRIVMAFVLGAAAVIGATAGAGPVLRRERANQPRVMAGEGRMEKRSGRPESCSAVTQSVIGCDLVTKQSSQSLLWNGRDVTLGCTSDGMITVSDAATGVVASADLTSYEYLTRVHVAGVRQDDGREALAVLAELGANRRRAMLMLLDADGRASYEELLERPAVLAAAPLSVCAIGDRDAIVIDLGAPVTYRAR